MPTRFGDIGRGSTRPIATPTPAQGVHTALGILRLQGFTGVLWVDHTGHATAEGVSDFAAPARLWEQGFTDTVQAVRALALGPGHRARVDLRRGVPVRQGSAWATLQEG
jgi:hypothetical protein